MDKLLYEIINEATPQIRVFHDGFFRREASLLSFLSIGGRKISDFSDFESFCVFLEEHPEQINNVNPAVESSMTVSTKERILDSIKNYPSDVKEYYLYYISTIRKIIASFKELIPSDTDAEGQSFRKYIEKISELFSNIITFMDAATHESLRKAENKSLPKDESKALLQERFFQLVIFSLTHLFVDFNMMTMLCMHFHQLIYEYYYGPKDKKSEIKETIKQAADSIVNLLSAQLNSVKIDTKQLIKDSKSHSKDLQDIKDKQEKVEDRIIRRNETIIQKVDNRNKVEQRKKLTQTLCANIIFEIRKKYNKKRDEFLEQNNITKYYTEFSVPQIKSIKREIQRWEQFQKSNGENGTQPPEHYTRMTSELEFKVFAEKIELEKYNEWKAFITEKYLTEHRSNL